MPFGNEQPEGNVQAGLAAQPLVTSADTSVENTGAVQNLIQAYRNGFVTNEDILDRVGQVGQAKKKALLEQLGEYVNPDVIQSRMSAAQLQTAQNQAATGLVQPMAQATQTQLGNVGPASVYQQEASRRALAGVQVGENNIQDFQRLGPWFGYTPDKWPTNPDGSPDYKSQGMLGAQFTMPTMMRQLAGQGLEVDPSRTQKDIVDPNSKKTGTKVFNKWGMDITPGSPGESIYRGMLMSTPGMNGMQPPIAPPALSHLITGPAQSAPQAPPVIGAPASGQAPSPAANEPDTTGTYDPNVGLVTGVASGFNAKPVEIRDDMQKQDAYKLWQQQSKAAQSFDNTVAEIKANEALPPSQRQPFSQLDFQLAEAAVALYQPNMAIREFKWGELTKQSVPVTEMVQNWKQLVGNTGSLTPQARQRLVDLGYSMVDGADQAARGPISGAVEMAKNAGMKNPQSVLVGDEHRVYDGVPFGVNRPANGVYKGTAASSSPAKPVTGTAAGVGNTITGPDGKQYRKISATQFVPIS